MGQMVNSGNISFPFSLSSKFLTWHWNSFEWWEVKESKSFKIKCLKRERDLPTLKIIQSHQMTICLKWTHIDNKTVILRVVQTKCIWELRSDQANVGRYQKLGKVVGIFQIIMRKLLKCCIQFGLARQTSLQGSSRYLRDMFECQHVQPS